jgi:hypothetical protein
MRLTLNGKAFEARPERPSATRLKKLLRRLKTNFIDSHELSARAKVSMESIHDFIRNNPEYVGRIGHKNWYGNPKAVKELRKAAGVR